MITEKQVWAALPNSGFLRSYVEWASRWTGATPGFHTVAGLALLAQSVPVDYAFPWSSPLRANFYGLLIGPSGAAGKGRTIGAARGVLKAAFPESEQEQPGSPEGCIESLESKPQIIFYDEFGDFLQRTQQGQLSGLRTVYTNLYDCVKPGHRLVRRPGRKPKPLAENPRLSILAGGTPSFLEEFTTRTDWEGGFSSRFFMIYATSERLPPSSFQGEREQERLARLLASYAPDTTQAATKPTDIFSNAVVVDAPPVEPRGDCAGWTLEAETLWDEWIRNLGERVKMATPLLAGPIHRSAGHCAKIAILLSWDSGLARAGGEWRVDRETLERAIAITELHIISASEIVENLTFDRDTRDERDLLDAIGEAPTLYSVALRRARLTAKRGQDAIRTLLTKKAIVRAEMGDGEEYFRRYSEERSNVIPFERPASAQRAPSNIFED